MKSVIKYFKLNDIHDKIILSQSFQDLLNEAPFSHAQEMKDSSVIHRNTNSLPPVNE